MTRLLIIIVLSLTLLAAIKAKQEELLINETELPTQADTTESRLDQQSDDPNTQPNSYKTQKKSKDRKLRFTLFKCRHACLF
jgi:uncharacterized protein YxeA